MLVSVKACNSGLNLVAEWQVFNFDPVWNPYIEEQAIARAHRMGQLRTVQIHRILVKNTVADRILELQEKKREIIEGALDENAAKQISRLGINELKFLFVSTIFTHLQNIDTANHCCCFF
jgi:SNF2 family DNA or RNA helicase